MQSTAPSKRIRTKTSSGISRLCSQIIKIAKPATKEQKRPLLQGVKLCSQGHPHGAVLISACIVMEGYDAALINNFCERTPFSFPAWFLWHLPARSTGSG